MGNQQFSNDASSILAASLSNVAVTVQVSTGDGALFPGLTGAEFFMIAVEDTTGNIEIMKCTGIGGDNLTVVRAQEGTTATAFTANLARVELRDTAGTLAGMLQKSGDTMAGNIDLGGHTISNGLANGLEITGGEIYATPIRGATGLTTNELAVPLDGSPATMGGAEILTVGAALPFPIGMMVPWYGALANIPAGWAPCDGNPYNGFNTPDMRDKYLVGAGLTYPLGAIGGSNTTVTDAGTLDLTGVVVAGHALVEAEMPSHTHGFWAHAPANYSGSGTFQTYENDATSHPAYMGQVNGNNIIQTTGGGPPGTAAGPGAAHTHAMSGMSAGPHTHTYPLPLTIAIYWIVFVGG